MTDDRPKDDYLLRQQSPSHFNLLLPYPFLHLMTPSPTIVNPRDGEKAVRGAHWVDVSGKSFKNPWPSFQDRVSD